MWSLGIILYEMTYGHSPYHKFAKAGTYALINAIGGDYEIQYKPVANRYAVDCMKRCLQKDPQKRPSISQLLAHPFLNPKAAQVEEKRALEVCFDLCLLWRTC